MAKNITIIMFHGNAGNIGHRVPIAKIIEENTGCNILMLEYRGYGMSTGTPNEVGLMTDAQTGLDWIRNGKETKGNRIVVYGQSLGGAVAIQLVAKNQEADDVVALILENTFTSIRNLIPRCALNIHLQVRRLFSQVPFPPQNISHGYVTNIGQA